MLRLVVLLTTIIPLFSNAQEMISLGSNYGFVMPHRKEMHRIVQGHSYGFNLQVSDQVNGEKEWHKLYLMPEIGAGFSYLNLGNKAELGSAYGFFLQMRLPFSVHEKWNHGINMGSGLGYVSKSFDVEENRFNTAIGSKINAGIFFEYNFRRWLSDRLQLDLGFRMTHYSNGAYQIPNLGLNMPGLCIGLSYDVSNEENRIAKTPLKYELTERKSHETQLVMIGAMRESFPATGPKYGVFGIGITENLRFSDRSSFIGGFEFFYNASLRKQLQEFKGIEAEAGDLNSFGISAGYGMHFGDMTLLFQMGHYIADEHKINGPWFHRIGWRKKIHGHLMATINLKSHFARADYFEFGLGWNL